MWALFAAVEDFVEGIELPDLDRGIVRTGDERPDARDPLDLVDPVSVAVEVC